MGWVKPSSDSLSIAIGTLANIFASQRVYKLRAILSWTILLKMRWWEIYLKNWGIGLISVTYFFSSIQGSISHLIFMGRRQHHGSPFCLMFNTIFPFVMMTKNIGVLFLDLKNMDIICQFLWCKKKKLETLSQDRRRTSRTYQLGTFRLRMCKEKEFLHLLMSFESKCGAKEKTNFRLDALGIFLSYYKRLISKHADRLTLWIW